MRTTFKIAVGAAAILAAFGASAQAYPVKDKNITIVVPFAAGSGSDIGARLLAKDLQTALKQTVIVDNKPGAGGVVGAETVARAKGDGYTVLFDASAFAVNPSLRKLSFDPQQDLLPVSLVVLAPNILVVPPDPPTAISRSSLPTRSRTRGS